MRACTCNGACELKTTDRCFRDNLLEADTHQMPWMVHAGAAPTIRRWLNHQIRFLTGYWVVSQGMDLLRIQSRGSAIPAETIHFTATTRNSLPGWSMPGGGFAVGAHCRIGRQIMLPATPDHPAADGTKRMGQCSAQFGAAGRRPDYGHQ